MEKMETIYTLKTSKIKLAVRESASQQVCKDPETTVNILRAIYQELDVDQEHFVCLLLNKANTITGFKVCFSGGQDESIIDVKIIYRNALLMGATAIILAHNHPSGRIQASMEDIAVTKKITEAGKILGINVLDHIILGNGYFSFREHGLI